MPPILFVLALVLLAAIAVFGYQQTLQQQALRDASLSAYDVLARIGHLESEAAAMEAEHLGFLMMGEAEPARRREDHFRTALADLAVLEVELADQAAQRALQRVRDALVLRNARMAETSEIARSKGLRDARALYRAGGDTLAVALREAFAALEAREHVVLEERAARVTDAEARLRFLLLGGTSLAFLALGGALLALLRMQRHNERVRARLAASDALQRAVVEDAGYMIIATDAQGTITLFNRAAARALGYEAGALVGKSSPARFHDAEEVRCRAQELSDELGRPVEPGFEVFVARAREGQVEDRRWTYVRSDGSRFPVQLAVSAVRGGDDEILGFVGVARDISERERAENAVRELNAALQAKAEQLEITNRELESFSYSVSHDLRAPLRHVDGYARMLQEDAADRLEPEHRRYLSVVRDGARRMGALIDDLLDLSRLGRRPLALERLDMHALARDALAEIGPDDIAERLVLHPLPPAEGDPVLLRQVWTNLLANAFKYSAPRGPEARVTVEGDVVDGLASYTVRDNGVGFDMRYVDKLFGVFQRLHRAEEFEGTGVGLAIVHRVVTRHGGSVEAFGEPGRGAAFTFRIPIAQERAA